MLSNRRYYIKLSDFRAVMETVGRKVGDVKVLLKSRNIFRQLEGGGVL
ncbi:hypothetical protein K040078D81_47980 [Blautia hominis]|uniref:Uncharacterized protein n=1 Tax=Blautia hominis TaxID=2025493 RepID=A0ABQ0BGU9_9FIRM